jgi:hypothetical protein
VNRAGGDDADRRADKAVGVEASREADAESPRGPVRRSTLSLPVPGKERRRVAGAARAALARFASHWLIGRRAQEGAAPAKDRSLSVSLIFGASLAVAVLAGYGAWRYAQASAAVVAAAALLFGFGFLAASLLLRMSMLWRLFATSVSLTLAAALGGGLSLSASGTVLGVAVSIDFGDAGVEGVLVGLALCALALIAAIRRG